MARPSEIVIVGIGPGPLPLLTTEAQQILLEAPRILFRTTAHPAHEWLREQGKAIFGLDFVYEIPRITFEHVYGLIADIVLHEARRHGRAVYALPGHPEVFETTTALIADKAAAERIDVRIVAGISFLDMMHRELGIAPADATQIVSAFDFEDEAPALQRDRGLIIAQLFAPLQPGGSPSGALSLAVARWIEASYPPAHPVSIVWSTGKPDYGTRSLTVPLEAFAGACDRIRQSASFASIYVAGTKK